MASAKYRELDDDLDSSQKGVSYERAPENPLRERLEIIHENFATEAHTKEGRANELEQEAAALRAEARGLRTAQEGVSRAIKEFVEAQAKNAKRFEDPNDIELEEEPRFVGSERVRQPYQADADGSYGKSRTR